MFLCTGVEHEDLEEHIKHHDLEKDKDYQQVLNDAVIKIQMA